MELDELALFDRYLISRRFSYPVYVPKKTKITKSSVAGRGKSFCEKVFVATPCSSHRVPFFLRIVNTMVFFEVDLEERNNLQDIGESHTSVDTLTAILSHTVLQNDRI